MPLSLLPLVDSIVLKNLFDHMPSRYNLLQQTALSGLFLAPVAAWFYKASGNRFNSTFWLSVSWLAVPVSIGAVLLWLWLLQKNAVQAGLWLFLCPPFGFALAPGW